MATVSSPSGARSREVVSIGRRQRQVEAELSALKQISDN